MLAILFIYGTVIASFLCLASYRLPRKLSVLAPRSYCDGCRRTLKWWQLIPIAGFLIQRGHCYFCKQKISPISTISELCLGTAFWFAGHLDLVQMFAALFSVATLMFLSLTDIADRTFYELGLLGLVPIFWIQPPDWNFVDIIMTILILISLAYSVWKQCFGFGDFEIMLLFGLALGLQQLLQITLIASSGALVFFLFSRNRQPLPFVPFLSAGFVISVLIL